MEAISGITHGGYTGIAMIMANTPKIDMRPAGSARCGPAGELDNIELIYDRRTVPDGMAGTLPDRHGADQVSY
jgi:hypothetical protein